MTSHTTFEDTFRERLLNIIYAHWTALGAPFSAQLMYPNEVIDPEALLWCSLEFLPTEPRLAEAVLEWFGKNKEFVVRHCVYKKSGHNDPRAIIWHALDKRVNRLPEIELDPASQPDHGSDSASQVVAFAERIKEQKKRKPDRILSQRVGRFDSRPALLLLRARNLIGQDIRHFLLVYLLANPHGAKLREIEEWSGYSYRSLSEAATRWQAADVATIDGGYCRLDSSEPWQAILHLRGSKIVPISWLLIFDLSVHLLRDLAKARRKGLDDISHVQIALKREAAAKLTSLLAGLSNTADTSISYLLDIFPNHEA